MPNRNWLQGLRVWMAAILFWSAVRDVVCCAPASSLLNTGTRNRFAFYCVLLFSFFYYSPVGL